MDIKAKSEIYWKLDYEGGFDYLVNGNDFQGLDPELDELVSNFKSATKGLEKFFRGVEGYQEEEV